MPRGPAVLVSEFHASFGLPRGAVPAPLHPEVAAARQRLLDEKVAEVGEAVRGGRLEEVAQELADVVYVAYGTALAYGIDLDAVLAEVHRANMSKLGADCRPLVRDGKVVKGEAFRRADVRGVLRRQGWQPDPA